MEACFVGQPGTDALGRSETFALCSLARPWFRGFHASWLSFFLAFTGWFALVPAMQYLVESEENDIDDQARKLSDVLSVLGTVLIRLVFGQAVERWGPRRPQTVLLGYGAVLVLASSQINSATSLYVTRFLISLVGAAFIPCQFWTTMLFSEKVVGRANAFAGGWGNLGGGLTILFMAYLIAQFRTVYDVEVAWRYAMVVPGTLMLIACIPLWFFTDDCPQGHWEKRKYGREMQGREMPSDLRPKRGRAVLECTAPYCDWRVWILFIQYACCFGVELTFNNAMTTYLYQMFTIDEMVGEVDCTATGSHNATTGQFFPECSILGKDTSAMVASLFGLQNLYARALGGIASDFFFKRYSLRGRLAVQFVVIFLEGIAIIVFSQLKSLPSAILCMVLLSILVQMAEGSTYSLTPFVRSNIGAVIGIVGAGGNIGAVSWATLLRYLDDSNRAFLLIGIAVVFSSFLTLALNLQGQGIMYAPKKERFISQSDTQSVYGDEARDYTNSSDSFTTKDASPVPGSLTIT